MFEECRYGKDNWMSNMLDFVHWCNEERKKCVPKGPCGQDVYTTSGQLGFDRKYPTFEDAYRTYMSEII